MVKEFINAMRRNAMNILDPERKKIPANIMAGFVNPFDNTYGKMQPTDFQAQIDANESWVYACVSAISESCAMAKLELHLRRGDKTELITDHIFLDVIQNVNPFMNAFELRELTETYLLLTGNAYWYLAKNSLGVPEEIWVVPSQDMKVIPDKNKFVSGYLYQPAGGATVAFSPEEIVHFKYPNANNLFYGISPLMAAAYAVDTDKYMSIYQATSFKNGALPAGVLSSDQVIVKAEADRMREQWKQLYGGSDKAGKIAILSKGLKFENITMSAQEMAYIQSKNINRDTILGIFRVPKSILGLVEDVNRANAEASEYTFSLRNIRPKLKRFEQKINEQIMPLYKQSGSNYLYVEFENVVPEDRALETIERTARLNSGLSTINEEREAKGLEPVEWGSVPLLPMNIIPFGSPQPEATPPAENPPAKVAENTQGSRLKALKYFSRARVWTIYKAGFDVLTKRFEADMKKLFIAQEKDVLNRLDQAAKGFKKDAADEIIFDMKEWEKKFIAVAGVDIDDTYSAGIKHGKKLINEVVDYDISNPAAQKWLKEKKFKFSFNTNSTTRDQLRGELNEGLAEGETTKQLAARVQKVFEFAKEYRSARIARTEVSDAENKGILDVWNKSGSVEYKEWLHGGGGFTPRPEHQAMSGEQVKMDELFSNGLLYAGDQSANKPEEVCNCTCTILPILKEE